MKKYKNRSEVPEKYKWDLSDFFEDENDFEESFQICQKQSEKLGEYVGCTKDAKRLYEFLKLEIETIALFENLYVYSYLINDQELGNSKSLERKNRTEILNVLLEKNISFFAPELLKLTKKEYEELFLGESKLHEFKHALDVLYRDKEHTLTENEEKIVSELTNSMNHFETISTTLLNSEHNYGKIKLDDGTEEVIATNNYRKLMRNKNVKIRKKVYKNLNEVISQYSTTSASLLNSYVGMNNAIAKIRNFESSWSQKLYDLNLTDKIFKVLVKAAENNLDVLHKYYKLRCRALGLKKLNMYDLHLELSNSDKEYTIEEAQEMVRNSVKVLGENYLEKYEKIIKNRYIDYCQYKGKCSGGYSFSTLTRNSRILMSFNHNFDSISTIAHEAGHNIHHQYISENNPLQYRETAIIMSEVTSLTNECLLSKYILENSNDLEEKKAGLENILRVITSNFYDAIREAKIEQEMYEEVLNGGVITKEFLDNKTYESLEKYLGDSVKLNDYVKNTWVTRSHYYMNFYLYNYAICICVAINVADKILNGDKDMLDKYEHFLTLGGDVWPIEAFKVLGVDLEDEEVYLNAIKYLDNLINEYNNILDMEVK